MKLLNIFLFFLSSLLLAQQSIPTGTKTTATVQNIDLGAVVQGDTNNNSLVVSVNKKYVDIDSVTVTGSTTLLPNTSIIGDSVINAENTNAFIVETNDTLTANADSTYTLNHKDGSAKLPLQTEEYARYEGSLSYQKVEGDASPIVTFNDNTSFTLNPITSTWQDTVLGFWGAVENDYLSFDGSDKVSTTNNAGDSISITFIPKILGVQQYALESLGDYKFSIRLETTNLMSVYSHTVDGYIVSMANNNISINTTDQFKVSQKLKTNGLMELYVADTLFRQVAWNPSTITVIGNLPLACSQGITTDGTYIYTTDANKISKYDLNGSLITSNSAVTHLGGITYKDNYLYCAWSDNVWADGAVSAIQKYDISDLSLISSDTISCGRGAGAVTFNSDENVWVVAESHLLSNRHDRIYKYDTSFNLIDSVQTKFMSYLGVQGISYRNNKYVIMSHSSYFYLTDDSFNLEKVIYYPTWTELQDAEWISDDSLWICAKNTNAGKIGYPFTDGTKVLASFTGLNIGADRSNNRKFTGNVYNVSLSNSGSTLLDLNGTDGNISSTTWTDASGNGNDGTISGATLMQPPFCEIALSDTAKMNFKINSIEKITDRIRVTKDNSGSIGLSTDISTVGSFVDNGTVHTTVGDYPFTVTSEVIPSSNVLHAPESLIASANITGIGVSWTDTNVPDTVLYLEQTFDVELEEDLLWTASSGEYISSTADKLKLTRNSATDTWHNAYITFNDLASYTMISFDAQLGTCWRVDMVVYGYSGGSPTIISNQTSETDTTFNFNVDASAYDSLRLFVQSRSTANGQYAYFDNVTIYKTTPSYDNWLLQSLAYLEGTPIGEWTYLSSNTEGTSYQHSGLSDGDKYGYRVAFILNGDTTTWSNTDTSTYINTSEPVEGEFYVVASDYWIREDGSTTWSDATDSSVGVTWATAYANKSSWGSGKTISIRSEIDTTEYYGEMNFSSSDGINNTTFVQWGRTKPKFTLRATLASAMVTGNWTAVKYENGGRVYSINLEAIAADSEYCPARLLLDGVEYPPRASMEYLKVATAYSGSCTTGNLDESDGGACPDLVADSVWAQFGSVYRWSVATSTESKGKMLYVWTPDSTNPATYYSNIEDFSHDNDAYDGFNNMIDIDNVDGLTFSNIVFEGGEGRTIRTLSCDDLTFDNCEFRMPGYGSIEICSGDNLTFTNNEFIGYDSTGYVIPQEYQAAREGLSINNDCDGVLIKGNHFQNYSTQAMVLRTSTNYSNYVHNTYPQNIIIDSNRVDIYQRPYARAFTIHSNEAIDAGYFSDSTYAIGLQPRNVEITRNIFNGINVGGKIGARNLIVMDNVFIGNPSMPEFAINHERLAYANDGHVFEGFDASSYIKTVIANNTFINIHMFMGGSGANAYGITINDLRLENNLFLNMSRKRKSTISEFYVGSSSGDYDWQAYKNADTLFVYNNYSFNDNLGASDDRTSYRRYYTSTQTWTYTEMEAYFASDGNSKHLADDNITDITSTDLGDILTDWQNGDYSLVSGNSARSNAKDVSAYRPTRYTVDRWGNTISNNIGANQE